MRALITGVAGYIGSQLAERLVPRGSRFWGGPLLDLPRPGGQPIDVERFQAKPIRDQPQQLLMLSNYLDGARREMGIETCERVGVSWKQVGRDGGMTVEPEAAIADADIVVGCGRSILEAMASGRAAYLFDHAGGGTAG